MAGTAKATTDDAAAVQGGRGTLGSRQETVGTADHRGGQTATRAVVRAGPRSAAALPALPEPGAPAWRWNRRVTSGLGRHHASPLDAERFDEAGPFTSSP
ncbi:hypothetical protein GCM10020367_62720 [Streptomyces sannanensis]|uniref:Uncharacterized protein n=1 Tax=Streptomyces sannanensis TaxID=285536 RepID=A0ABP6SMF7_9ACTN